MARPTSSKLATIPLAVSTTYPDRPLTHPVIIEVYHPDTGWNTLRGLPLELERIVKGTYRRRITPAYASKLRRSGVTRVSLDLGDGRSADFTTTELCRRWPPALPAETMTAHDPGQLLLGGTSPAA